jgi:hypothetical protein
VTPIPASLADLTARLPSGGAVYIDRDWLRDRKRVTATSALVFDPGSGLRWAGGAACASGDDPDADAWWLLDTLAGRVAVAARTAAGKISAPVLVPGDGLVATRVRARLAGAQATGGKPPAVVVETSGSAEGLDAACAVVADLGTVVLAVTPLGAAVAYDLYVDVHRRGLRVVGVPDPTESDRAGAEADVTVPATLEPGREAAASASPWLVLRA